MKARIRELLHASPFQPFQNKFAAIRLAARRPDSWVDITPSGFCLKHKRLVFRPSEQPVRWDEVREIYAHLWDCWVHVFGFLFVCTDGRRVGVGDKDHGWQEFERRVLEVYPGFDRRRMDEVDRAFPGEACLLCWARDTAPPTVESSQGPRGIGNPSGLPLQAGGSPLAWASRPLRGREIIELLHSQPT